MKLLKARYWFHALLVLMVIILTSCFIFVYDLQHTANCSLAFLQGHFLDFYDYNINQRGTGTIVYYPTIYLLFALWNIPLRLMNIASISGNNTFILIYEKVFGFVFLTGVYLRTHSIAKKLFGEIVATNAVKIMAFGMPIFILFEFPWGLYDTVWLFFLLLGIECFIDNKLLKGIFAFAIALTVKTFVLFLIVPILCYKYKKLLHLIASVMGVSLLYILETVVYWNSQCFRENVMSPLDGGFLITAMFGVSLGRLSVFLLFFIMITIFLFYIDSSLKNDPFGFVLGPFCVAGAFAAFSQVTPGWTIMYIPFLAILIGCVGNVRQRKVMYLCNMGVALGEIVYILSTRAFEYGETAIAAGIFGKTIYRDENAYFLVQSMSDSFLTTSVFVNGANGLMINYGLTLIAGIIIFFIITFAVKYTRGELSSYCVIDDNEKMFMFKNSVFVVLIYVAFVVVGTIQLLNSGAL